MINQRRINSYWLFLLPLLVPILLFAYQRMTLTRETTFVGVSTSMGTEQFDPDAGLAFSMEWMAKRLQSGPQKDLIEMRWADGSEMFISYRRKQQELQYGLVGKEPRYVAYGVTAEDIVHAAKHGGSFKNFKNYR